MLKKLLKDIFKQKWIYFLLVVWIIHQILLVSVPYLSSIFINYIQNKNLGSEFWNFIYLGCFIVTLEVLLWFYKEYFKKWLIANFEIKKSLYYYKKFFSLDYEHRINEWTWKIITKINRWIDAQVTLFNSFFNFIIIFIIRLSIIGTIIFYTYKPFIGVFIILWIIFTILNKQFSKKIKTLTDKEQDISENISRQTNKMIMESSLIKISNKHDYEIWLLSKIYSEVPQLRQNIFINNNLLYTALDLIFHILEIISYVILWFLVIKSSMTLWEMVMLITYIWRVWWPIEVLMNNISEYRNQISKYEALEKFVNQENKIKDWENNYVLKDWEIVFENINFWYSNEKQILKGFNLKIEWWKTLALVWHSGSGKSTLIKLILRNYLLNDWNIKIDWQDLAGLKISTFYENIWYLSQEPAVFDGTIKENLMYGMSDKIKTGQPQGITPTENINVGVSLVVIQEQLIWEALKNVWLDELIKESKDGLNTEIWEKWLKLSGWEKQRLAIARIFLKNPKILILDEPTSALDSISENKITHIINKAMKDRTVIVIAHRLQTVMEAHKIVVIEKWNIVETGTHKELLWQKWIYSTLVDLQRWVINE